MARSRCDEFVPPAPSLVYVRLMKSLGDPDVSAGQIASLIGADPGLSAHILRAVNSCFFGVRERVGSLLQAIALLGHRTLEMTALSYCIKQYVGDVSAKGFDVAGFWAYSLAAAAAANQLAFSVHGQCPDEAFVAGLMSRLGAAALYQQDPDRYREVLAEVESSGRCLHAVELDRLGVSHAEIGGRLLETWHMPEHMAAAVVGQYDPTLCIDARSARLARILHVAGQMGECIAEGDATKHYRRMLTACCEALEMNYERAEDTLREASDRTREAEQMFDLYVEEDLDVDAIIAEAREHITRLQGEVDVVVGTLRHPAEKV